MGGIIVFVLAVVAVVILSWCRGKQSVDPAEPGLKEYLEGPSHKRLGQGFGYGAEEE